MSYYRLALVPDDFKVPELLDHELFRIRPLLMKDAVIDYETIMSDYRSLCDTLSPNQDYSGEKSYDLETDIKFLAWHECEFYYRRSSFVFAVERKMDDIINYTGCFYIYPSPKKDHDAAIYLWVRKVSPDDNLEELIFQQTQRWIKEAWPFKNPVYPGRTTSWEDYEKLPGGKTYDNQGYQWSMEQM